MIGHYDANYANFASNLCQEIRSEAWLTVPELLKFTEWLQLKPGRRLVFTDPIVITGPLTNAEIAVRSSASFYLFVPPGEDERLLRAAGLELLRVEDLTGQLTEVSRWRHAARDVRAAALRQIEGDATFEGQQEYLRVVASIASERRLSRFAFLATRPV